MVTLEWEAHDPMSHRVKLSFLGDAAEQGTTRHHLWNQRGSTLMIRGSNTEAPSVRLDGIRNVSLTTNQAAIDADELVVDWPAAPSEGDARYLMKAQLTPGGIVATPAIWECRPNGGIDVRPAFQGEVLVTTSRGTWRVGEDYDHHEGIEHGNRMISGIQRSTVSGPVSVAAGTEFLKVHSEVERELWDICLILSLCYRVPVRFYEIRYVRDPESGAPQMGWGIYARYRRPLQVRGGAEEELIGTAQLVDGWLDTLVQAYQAARDREALRRAVSFLATSNRAELVEASYFLAYAALELVVNACVPTDRHLVGTAGWGRLSSRLTKAIQEFASEEKLPGPVGELVENLPCVRRRSSSARIIKAATNLKIQTEDLWIRDGFEGGVRKATKMRNELFHGALVLDAMELIASRVRISVLTERLVLRLLDWPADRVALRHEQQLVWANSSLPEE